MSNRSFYAAARWRPRPWWRDPPIVNIGTVVQASLQGYNLVLVAAVETKYDQIVFARKGINKLGRTQRQEVRHQRLRLRDPQRS